MGCTIQVTIQITYIGGFYDPLYTKMSKLPFIGFIFFIVILQTFFLALCQNTFNGTFSIINQIESYLALRRLTKEISYQEMFLQKKLSVNLVKTLEKNLQQHGKVSSGLFSLLLKISRLISSQNQNMSIYESHVTSESQQNFESGVLLILFGELQLLSDILLFVNAMA